MNKRRPNEYTTTKEQFFKVLKKVARKKSAKQKQISNRCLFYKIKKLIIYKHSVIINH